MNSRLSKKDSFYRLSKLDIIFASLIVVFSLFYIIKSLRVFSQGLKGSRASIYHQGELIKQVSLDKDKQISVLKGKLELEVKNGLIRVIEADCLRQVCVNRGWIGRVSETIVCLPNKILVEVSQGPAALVDAVAY
jgi:hypothetical protein